jgi:hypothetical protein
VLIPFFLRFELSTFDFQLLLTGFALEAAAGGTVGASRRVAAGAGTGTCAYIVKNESTRRLNSSGWKPSAAV